MSDDIQWEPEALPETSAEETTYEFKVEAKEPSVSNLEQQQNAKLIQDAVIAQRQKVEGSALLAQTEGIPVSNGLEPCQSLEAKLSDGRIIKMQEPETALQFNVDLWFDVQAQTSRQQALAIMHVVEINGEPVKMPTKKSELMMLASKLKTRGVNDVFILYQRHFAGIVDLQVLKKNL